MLYAAVMFVVRLIRNRPDVPLAALLAVAIFWYLSQEPLRLQQRGSVTALERRQALLIGLVGTALWAGGVRVDSQSTDEGRVAIGGTIGAAAVVIVLALLRNAGPRVEEPPG